MEKYIWSLDLSTTNVGSALWDSSGRLIELKHLTLKVDKSVPKEHRYIHKADSFKNYCAQYKERIETELKGIITHIIIEEPIGGSTNANTVALLFSFNGISCYILYEIFNIIPIKISVHDSRKLFLPEFVHVEKRKGIPVEVLSFPLEWVKDKKECIRQKVAKLEPQIIWEYDKKGKLKNENYDLSDSFAVGFSALKLLGIIK